MAERVIASAPEGRNWTAEILTPLLFAVAIFVAWEGAVWLFKIPLYIVPPPHDILSQFVRKFPRIWDYTLVTGSETMAGVFAAVLICVPPSLLGALSPLFFSAPFPPSL